MKRLTRDHVIRRRYVKVIMINIFDSRDLTRFFDKMMSDAIHNCETYRVRYYRGRVSYFNQSEARKGCFLASDWLKYETLPRKFRTLLCFVYCAYFICLSCPCNANINVYSWNWKR